MPDNPTRLPIVRTLLGDHAWSQSIKSGLVTPDNCTLSIDPVREASTRFKHLILDNGYDAAEIAAVTFLQAKAYGKGLVLLPIVVLGGFHHKSIASNRRRAVLTPETLAGKRIGVRTYSQTTGVWVRGILQHDYGVDPGAITWVTQEDAHLAEYSDPPNCERGPADRSIVEQLVDGELDAAILGLNMPKDPDIVPVIADPEGQAASWQAHYGIVPINHMFAVSAALCRDRPDVVRGLYSLLLSERIRESSPFPAGFDADWSALDLLSRYAFEQNIIPRRYSVGELFDDAARLLR